MALSRVRSERLVRQHEPLGDIQPKSQSSRNLDKLAKESGTLSSGQSRRNLLHTESSRTINADVPEDEEQKAYPALSKLPAAGFQRLKTLWANREVSYGFSNPLSTWSRPYAKQNKGDKDVKVKFDPNSKAYTGHYDPDRSEEKYKQFGCSIQECPRVAVPPYKEPLPSVLLLLKEQLKKQNGYHVEGVFRVAASFEDQKAIKKQVDDGTFPGCKTQDDAMCMAALLKEWFRTMPVRLLNSLPLTSIRAGKSNYMKELPEPNLSVFLWLCDLLAEVVQYEHINRMSVRAMAIVIAPNLYSPGDSASQQEIIQETNGAVSIVEAALRDAIERRKTMGTIS